MPLGAISLNLSPHRDRKHKSSRERQPSAESAITVGRKKIQKKASDLLDRVIAPMRSKKASTAASVHGPVLSLPDSSTAAAHDSEATVETVETHQAFVAPVQSTDAASIGSTSSRPQRKAKADSLKAIQQSRETEIEYEKLNRQALERDLKKGKPSRWAGVGKGANKDLDGDWRNNSDSSL